MPDLKPAYLIHGDDHGAIAERRAGLQALALRQGDAGSAQAYFSVGLQFCCGWVPT